MQTLTKTITRRQFLRTTGLLAGSVLAMPAFRVVTPALADPLQTTSRVALTAGADHPDNVFQALQRFKKEIATAIGTRPILIKPNNVIGTSGTSSDNHGDVLLSDTPVDGLEGVLEFLKSIGRTDVTIGEACATDPTMVAFETCGYLNLAKRYPVRFIDLNQQGYEMVSIYNGAGRKSIRISKVLLDPNIFVISAPKPKTHNNVVATLSLKNVAMGSPIIDVGLYRSIGKCQNDKGSMHGAGNQDLHDNLHLLAHRLAPDLAIVDGWEGMEGNGPCWGTRVSQRFAVASLDWVSADRVCVELMGINPTYPAYLNYCHQTGLGQYDLTKIEVEGESVATLKRTYRLHDNIATQLGMRTTARV
jgi:uncharacterized protein (DUF362 family)